MATERDELTGVETTGHEWDGLRELNNPLPKWWLYVLYATIVFSVIYSLFVPPIPGVPGILDNTRSVVRQDIADARAAQGEQLTRIAELSLEEIRADAGLRDFVRAGGGSAFAENCAPCHGAGGAGVPGFPALVDDVWIWGGTLDDIHLTIVHGIRNEDIDSRWSEMIAFGRDGILTDAEIDDVAHFTLAMSGIDDDPEAAARGEQIYLEQCAACHGDSGEGDMFQGAPRLNDAVWLYGGTFEEVVAQIHDPRHGVMPPWADRLDETTIKMLTVYVHTLGGGQ
ncbi:MAG: cytochrome-c oxidase, cbb3-type subunit III [Rhodospirillales bacterium]|nr:cytochrome-c oxidase, cbb3-type subunit III [Rhodospirillales bacterium]